MNTEEREKKTFWCYHDGVVWQVTGHSCGPANPDFWWCPEIGYSMSEGGSLFGTEREAVQRGIEEVEAKLARYTKILNTLKSNPSIQ